MVMKTEADERSRIAVEDMGSSDDAWALSFSVS